MVYIYVYHTTFLSIYHTTLVYIYVYHTTFLSIYHSALPSNNYLFQFKGDQLPPTFKRDFTLLKNIKNANLRNRNDFCIPRVKSIKIGLLPPHNFSKTLYENKLHFSRL